MRETRLEWVVALLVAGLPACGSSSATGEPPGTGGTGSGSGGATASGGGPGSGGVSSSTGGSSSATGGTGSGGLSSGTGGLGSGTGGSSFGSGGSDNEDEDGGDGEEQNDPACPATAPADATTCTAPDATECDYADVECECAGGVWTCADESSEGSEDEDGG